MTQDPRPPSTVAPPRVVAWARVFPAVQPTLSKNLRRGAWYPVVANERPDRVSLLMGTRVVDVPRRVLEVRHDRPRHFSVVNRVDYRREPRRRSLYNLGKLYAVCPHCSARLPLWGHPEKTRCTGCRYEGEIGWWEA